MREPNPAVTFSICIPADDIMCVASLLQVAHYLVHTVPLGAVIFIIAFFGGGLLVVGNTSLIFLRSLLLQLPMFYSAEMTDSALVMRLMLTVSFTLSSCFLLFSCLHFQLGNVSAYEALPNSSFSLYGVQRRMI